MTGRIDFIGPLGVGKSTLLRALRSSDLPYRFLEERLQPIDRDRRFWRTSPVNRSFFIQSVFYLNAYRQTLMAARSPQIVMADFSLLVHHNVYSTVARDTGHLSAIEFRRLHALHQTLHRLMPPLLAVVVCKAEAQSIADRVIERGRTGESIDLRYVLQLSQACDRLVSSLRIPTIIADLNKPASSVSIDIEPSLRQVASDSAKNDSRSGF